MSDHAAVAGDPADQLLALYDRALPQVYGYLVARCGERALAEELTAEAFLAAVDAVRRRDAAVVTAPWLVGVARHKLVDHWRRQAREQRGLSALGSARADEEADDWDVRLDALRARATLADLAPLHRAVLTLRYLDDLPVAEVAVLVDRSLHATEGLLVRARAAFRRRYDAEETDDA
ncbi:MAG TPA: sigma-70 family RNA polymerase sigma factor [Acidimicrobiales bacterium]|nr:sigma-70 family RNA polymerase sigma factor [Acidimicrobiales bacterium]